MQAGSSLELSSMIGRIAGLVAVYLLLTVLQRFLSRNQVLRTISLQLNLLMLTLLLMLFLKPVLLQMNSTVADSLLAAAMFLGITVGLKLADILLFDLLAQWRQKPQVPLVVRDLGRWGLSAVALLLIVHEFFPGVNLNVLAASSLVVGYIVGNATQDTLGNMISGLALNTEKPFQIGDWVTVSGQTGVVVDTTWRATRLRTREEDYIVIPNSSIAKESILNFSRPTRNHGCYLAVGVSYETPPNKARRVILEVLAESSEVCVVPPPKVFLTSYGDFAVNFSIKFFVTDFANLPSIQSGVMDRLWYAFRRENITIPFPIQDCRESDAVAAERIERAARKESVRQLLSGVDLFESLSAAEMVRLVEGATLQIFAGDEKLCRQGEAGDSFYIIRSGSVGVWVAGADGIPVVVAHLGSGAFFGEMSLLTGEPRSATVIAEGDVEVVCVSRQDFSGLLLADADLAGKLASVLEKRMAARHEKLSSLASAKSIPATQSALVARILSFFGLE